MTTQATEPHVRFAVEPVPADNIDFNEYNPNSLDPFHFEKLVASIREYGFIDPVTSLRQDSGRILVIDGEHRAKAGIEAGYTEIPCMVIGDEHTISPARRRALTLLLNDLRGQHDPAKTADVLQQIEAFALPDEAIVLPYSESQLTEYLLLADGLPPDAVRLPYPDPKLPSRDPHEPAFARRTNANRESWQTLVFQMPADAAAVVRQALDTALADGAGEDDWQSLEMIAASYLSGPHADDGDTGDVALPEA